MKLHGNLFQEIVADDNILNAHKHAKKGKGWYSEVRVVEQDIANGGHMLDDLKQSLTNFCAFHSYERWLEACDSFRLYQKYGKPLETAVNAYYAKNILLKKKGMVKDDQSRNRPGDGSPGKAACG